MAIGLLFMPLLAFANRADRAANRFLSLSLAVVILRLVGVLGMDINFKVYYTHWSRLPLNFSLALGPLIYFYVLKITRPEYKIRWKDLLHFSPLVFELCVFGLQVDESIRTGTDTYKTIVFQHLNPVIQCVALISIVIYLVLSCRLINNFHRQLMPYVSQRSRYVLRWLYRLLSGYKVICLFWLSFTVANSLYHSAFLSPGYLFYLLSAIIMIWIAIAALLRREVDLPVAIPLAVKPLPSADLIQKGAWLRETIEKKRLYEDAELTLNSLAEKLDIHHHELSRIVNAAFGKNFNDFINEYRIREVGSKIKDPAYDHITLLGIAFESGFNSKSTFNRVFKEMTGKSPAEYKKGLKKERPTYHLRRYAYTPAVISFHETIPEWSQNKLNRNYMIKNHFKTAWRNIVANRLFATLNIAGLAIGICVCITLFACASHELSFDRMYKNSKDIYRVNLQSGAQFDYKVWAQLPGIAGPTLLKDIPQVKAMTRLLKYSFGAVASLKAAEKNFSEKGLYMADTAILKIFDFSFTEGNARTAFNQPFSVIISESAKQRFFGNEAAIGKLIVIDNRGTLHVSGVYKDLPENSTIDCDMIYNIMDSWAGKEAYWGNSSYETYLLLQPDANAAQVQKQATALVDKYIPKKDQFFTGFILQPLADIHLYSADIRAGFSARIGSIGTVKALLFLSLLVLGIACINYMNLATARSEKRSKGVGVNKVLGAERHHLLTLFYIETALLALIAIVIGYGACFILQPFFQNITGIRLQASALLTAPILFSLLATWVLVTLLAGSYPAISISGISPLVLMNKLKLKHSAADFIRKALVVFQFASSIILIISVIIILQQINYIRDKDLGYNPKGIVAVSIKSAQNKQQSAAFINDLGNMASVESASPSQSIPGDIESGKSIRKLENDKNGYPVLTCRTDGSIIKTMQLSLLAGTSIPRTLAVEDTNCYLLINDAVRKYLGYKTPQEAIGRYANTEMHHRAIISGVLRNFNYESLKNEIGGYLYYIANKSNETTTTLLIRYNTRNLPDFMQQVQATFKKDMPNSSFDYEFLDTHIQNLYASEKYTASTATVFSLLAIFVACLGLFGLAASIAERRTKEIGIRKVLGASVPGIAKLLTGDFLKLVIISIVIASPIAWFMMNKWLTAFSYRINVSIWAFVISGVLAIVFALLTISSHAIKSATANPVKSLRSE
ncbi:FtsX-like permease family protein [Mucilaginibacter sp. L3T2-6]|uniref:ABC transporter permease n=1 Tax=Mucilaginibacter sp. L3T2-6 TaxID=3062491 RepID=UPI002675758F|nr:FtsX-like permease family protein [Mucilaginibacter sp. L3T2-6]MDO3640567.1 ABC transporter permease [Mucilaginibacter sp. L3T2-6]MDV6213094.1 FtsX-like permease family protein [Mucilaginibacter sp. L3T2-6]